MMAKYQAELSAYADGQPDENAEVEKFRVKNPAPEPEPVDRVIELLFNLRSEVEAATGTPGDMPEADLPHTIHPPDLLPKQERGYRLINHWKSTLTAKPRVDNIRLEKMQEMEKSQEYGQHFTIQRITLHIEVGPLTIQLTPDGANRIVTADGEFYAGNLFEPNPSPSYREQLLDLDKRIASAKD